MSKCLSSPYPLTRMYVVTNVLTRHFHFCLEMSCCWLVDNMSRLVADIFWNILHSSRIQLESNQEIGALSRIPLQALVLLQAQRLFLDFWSPEVFHRNMDFRKRARHHSSDTIAIKNVLIPSVCRIFETAILQKSCVFPTFEHDWWNITRIVTKLKRGQL